MTEEEIGEILNSQLVGLDEDIVNYLIGAVDGMSVAERKSNQALFDTISPFLIDSGFSNSEDEAMDKCRGIAVAFGGSGFKSSLATLHDHDDSAPILLSAPVKMANSVHVVTKQQFMDVTVFETFDPNAAEASFGSAAGQGHAHTHTGVVAQNLDIRAIPTTQKDMRKQRKANEQLQKILRQEAVLRQQAEAEMAAARMAAIRASRTQGRQANTGLNIERFSIPHPSGRSDLLTDASLTLVNGRRYGLIGKNGAGKSTLLRQIANYKLPSLTHLRILLVDQHVEGDDESALEWVLRADVERSALLEEEAKLLAYMHGVKPRHAKAGAADDLDDEDDSAEADTQEGSSAAASKKADKKLATNSSSSSAKALPAELKGVNLEIALAEVYDRMDAIGVSSAEIRARKILEGLGFTKDMMERPTNSLSGGWAMRAALAAALFVRPNLLLLDEPTNHLDLHALVWLEHWLVHYFHGMVLVVSHDSIFLDSICTDILELKSTLVGQATSSLIHYTGDFSTYMNTVEENKIAQARLRIAYEKEKEKLQEFISRDGKKYDTPQHQAQVSYSSTTSLGFGFFLTTC